MRKIGHLKGSLLIGGLTFFLAVAASFLSNTLLAGVDLWAAVILLLVIICVGIMFDTLGVAATAASEEPMHARASKKIPGAREAIFLIRNADRMAAFCCDIVGDICGIISGAVGAYIVLGIVSGVSYNLAHMIVVALTAALTVAGKAYGKRFGIQRSDDIIFCVGVIFSCCKRVGEIFSDTRGKLLRGGEPKKEDKKV